MKYAKLIKLGGELIEAGAADYSDYRGFLRCPECGEPVFLRATHQRHGREVAAAFAHYRAIPEVSICQLRVGGYSSEEVQRRNAQARGQRLQKLRISLWKILKSNLSMDFRLWATWIREAKDYPFFGEVCDYGRLVLISNSNFILDQTFDQIAQLMIERSSKFNIEAHSEKAFSEFLSRNEKDWRLHCKIAKEALEFSLNSKELELMQYRLAVCLSHPSILARIDPSLIDLDTATQEWRQKFVGYLTLQICFVFLAIDWLAVFK